MSDIYEKHGLSDGRSVWVQRVKVPGVRKPQWSVVLTGAGFEAPDITAVKDFNAGLGLLADVLREDVLS